MNELGEEPDGYTLGNPNSYEPFIDEYGHLAHKATGGAWFPSLEAAQAALGEDGSLPAAWFPDRRTPIPGRVYALFRSKPGPRGTEDSVGARRLTEPCRVGRVP